MIIVGPLQHATITLSVLCECHYHHHHHHYHHHLYHHHHHNQVLLWSHSQPLSVVKARIAAIRQSGHQVFQTTFQPFITSTGCFGQGRKGGD